MFTIIGGDGKEYGPVSAEQIRAWLAGGRANLDTKAKAAGSEEWRRLGDFPDFSGEPVSAAATSAPPPIAADAKDPKAYADELIARGSNIDISQCIGRSFDLWKAHFLPLVGVTLLIVIVQTISGMIPFLGILSSLLLNGVFYGGLYYYYFGKMRGERRDVGDAFAGFSRAFVPLMLASLLTSVIVGCILMLSCAPVALWFAKEVIASGGHFTSLPTLTPLAMGGIFIGGIVVIYFSIAWAFTFPLIIDQGLGPWTAMEVSRRVVGRHWFAVLFTIIAGVIVAMLGLFALIVGVFFTMPLMFGTMAYAYESLFRPASRVV